MKLDYEFIKKILICIQESEKSFVTNKEIFSFLKIENDKIDKIYYHLKILKNIGIITSSSDNCGFLRGSDGSYSIFSSNFEMNFSGHKVLESMLNDKIMNKIKDKIKLFGIETLKQIPGLVIELLNQKQ